jgi:hypothetical protein
MEKEEEKEEEEFAMQRQSMQEEPIAQSRPSSHCSPDSRMPLPQYGGTEE